MGQVIDLEYPDGETWRVKVTHFDPILNLHTIDSTALDVTSSNPPNWFYSEGVSLNAMLDRDELSIPEYMNILSLPSLDQCINERQPLDDNALGHNFKLTKLHNLNQVRLKVLEYLAERRTHVCQVLLRDKICRYEIDLNAELIAGTLSHFHSQHVLDHLRSALGVDSRCSARAREAPT